MAADLTVWDGLGIVGSLTICAAYYMVSRGRMDAQGLRYQAMNLGGSALLLISLYVRPNPGAIVIEVLWAAIALTAILQILRRKP